MAIAWGQQMSIDHGLIDADHRSLIDLANSVDAVRPGAAMQGEIAAILDRLNAHAQVHFDREERLQAAARFINASAHGRYHASVLRDLDAVRAECKRKMDPKQLWAFQLRVGEFLDEWLVDHIVRSDALMKPFVAEMQSHSEGVVPLAEAVRLSEVGSR